MVTILRSATKISAWVLVFMVMPTNMHQPKPFGKSQSDLSNCWTRWNKYRSSRPHLGSDVAPTRRDMGTGPSGSVLGCLAPRSLSPLRLRGVRVGFTQMPGPNVSQQNIALWGVYLVVRVSGLLLWLICVYQCFAPSLFSLPQSGQRK